MAARRKALELSQTDLANRLRARGLTFHQQTVQKVESGDRAVRLDEAFVIAEILESTVEDMVKPLGQALEMVVTVDRFRRAADTAGYNQTEIWAEFSDDFDQLLLLFRERYAEESKGKTTFTVSPTLAWIMAWVIKGLWVDQAFEELATTLNGIYSTGGNWREDLPLPVRGAPDFTWLASDIDSIRELPVTARPLSLADLNPHELYEWLTGDPTHAELR